MIYGIDYLIMGVIGRMLGIIGSFLLPGYVRVPLSNLCRIGENERKKELILVYLLCKHPPWNRIRP